MQRSATSSSFDAKVKKLFYSSLNECLSDMADDFFGDAASGGNPELGRRGISVQREVHNMLARIVKEDMEQLLQGALRARCSKKKETLKAAHIHCAMSHMYTMYDEKREYKAVGKRMHAELETSEKKMPSLEKAPK